MAVTTNLTTLNDCDDDTGFTELPAPHGAGAAPALDEENYIQNNTLPASVSQASGQATGTGAGFQYTHGSTFTLNNTNDVFLMWTYYAAPTNLSTWAAGGGRIGIGTEDNLFMFNAMGADFGNYPYGGWQNTAIDPDLTQDTSIGTPSGTTFDSVAFLPNVLAKITKGTPIAMDVVRYGRGDIVVIGTETFTSMATANDAVAARWGLFQATSSGYEWKGLMNLGTAASSLSMTDSNKSIIVSDTTRVSSGFNKIEINHASTVIDWTSISISGVETSKTGSAPVSAGDFEVIAATSVAITSCSFTDLGSFILQSNTTIASSTFRRCGLITQGNAGMDNCTIDAAEGTVGIITSSLSDLTNSTLASKSTGHAIELTDVTSPQSWSNIDSGYAATDGVTGNETIYITATSAADLTINRGAGASTPTIRKAASYTGTVSVVASVTIDVNVKNQSGGNITGALVYIDEDLDTAGEIANTTTDVNGDITQASYSGAATTATLRVRLYGYKAFVGTIGLTANSSTNVILITDPQQT